MHRQKGTLNTPQSIIDEIVTKHRNGETIKLLSAEYAKPFKTIKNMCTRENNKMRRQKEGLEPKRSRGRKPAVSLAEYKYENKRLKMENELLRDFLHAAGRK
jgi:gentisate 1,2-dioxygenase